jgi:hypothetical protein
MYYIKFIIIIEEKVQLKKALNSEIINQINFILSL